MTSTQDPITPGAKLLGDYLRDRRGRVSIVSAAVDLCVNKNTVVAYEYGRSLPDVTFLALHAARFGSDFTQLLVLRLQADAHAEARKLVGVVSQLAPQIPKARSGQFSWSLKTKLLEDIIEAVELEEKRWRTLRLTPAVKAGFISSLYAMLRETPDVRRDQLRHHVSMARPLLAATDR